MGAAWGRGRRRGVSAGRRLEHGGGYLEVGHLEELDRDAQQLLRLQVEHVGRQRLLQEAIEVENRVTAIANVLELLIG